MPTSTTSVCAYLIQYACGGVITLVTIIALGTQSRRLPTRELQATYKGESGVNILDYDYHGNVWDIPNDNSNTG